MKESLKMYKSAPLPFQGQKRRWIKEFVKLLENCPEDGVYVDLFGGSGLLSHIAKRVRPDAKIVYNDFDDYHIRLENIERTNKLLAELRVALKDYKKDTKITGETYTEVINILTTAHKKGFVDWITISSSLCFAMSYFTMFEQLSKQTLYNRVVSSAYCADGYIEGLEIVKKSYKELFDEYNNQSKVVFFIDPPYLSTDVSTYSCGEYWKLKDYLDILQIVKGKKYIYFTSEKSSIVELCEWLEANKELGNPFSGALKKELNTNPTGKTAFKDIMLYKV